MKSIDVETLDDAHEQRADFRRANGAPLVSDPDNPGKSLRYSRPSGYAKPLDDEEALVNWRIWKAMNGVAHSKALAAKVMSTKDDDKESKKAIREEALDKGKANEQADIGTALHAMTARIEDPDDDFEAPDAYADDLAAYVAALDHYGLVSEHVEVALVNDEYRAAGTADRIFRLTKPLTTPTGEILPVGTLVLGDLKTGAKLDFSLPGFSVQMALYVCGTFYDVITEKRLPTPVMNQDWTVLIHLPVGKARCEVSWMSVETGNLGAWISHEVKKWRRQWKNGTYDATTIPDPPVDPVPQLEAELGAVVIMDNDMVPQMVEYVKARIRTIGEHPEARKWLGLGWPEGVPTPKQGLTKPIHLVLVLDLLDSIEKKYSIPFEHPDPRASEGHKSQIDRSNGRGLVSETQPQPAKETDQ